MSVVWLIYETTKPTLLLVTSRINNRISFILVFFLDNLGLSYLQMSLNVLLGIRKFSTDYHFQIQCTETPFVPRRYPDDVFKRRRQGPTFLKRKKMLKRCWSNVQTNSNLFQHAFNSFQHVSVLLKRLFKRYKHFIQQMLGKSWSKCRNRLKSLDFGLTQWKIESLWACREQHWLIHYRPFSILARYLRPTSDF